MPPASATKTPAQAIESSSSIGRASQSSPARLAAAQRPSSATSVSSWLLQQPARLQIPLCVVARLFAVSLFGLMAPRSLTSNRSSMECGVARLISWARREGFAAC
jgi:hypothetical protein